MSCRTIYSDRLEGTAMKKIPLKEAGIYFLKTLLALGILFFLIRKVDFQQIPFQDIHFFWIFAAAFCLVAQMLLTGLRWYALLRVADLPFSLGEVMFLTLQGIFFSLFIPGGAVGGDLVKAGILAKRSLPGKRFNGVFSILIDRLCGLIGLLLGTLFCCGICYTEIMNFPVPLQMTIWCLCGGCVLGLSAAG
jgi:uncharacterized membrane protein YbhN (UPF0104 family)